MADKQHAQLIAWLQDRGHTAGEIDQILAKVTEYDNKVMHESVFDSIDEGTFDIEGIIREALGRDLD